MGLAYKKLRAGIEQAGGRMTFERSGSRYGTWTVEHQGKSKIFDSSGNGFPEIDRCYSPKVQNPRSSSDYTNKLIPDAVAKLLSTIG